MLPFSFFALTPFHCAGALRLPLNDFFLADALNETDPFSSTPFFDPTAPVSPAPPVSPLPSVTPKPVIPATTNPPNKTAIWPIALISVVVFVIGGSLLAVVLWRRYRRRVRPTRSEQIDEHATDPLLIPAELF
jgi:hypothetical protein